MVPIHVFFVSQGNHTSLVRNHCFGEPKNVRIIEMKKVEKKNPSLGKTGNIIYAVNSFGITLGSQISRILRFAIFPYGMFSSFFSF